MVIHLMEKKDKKIRSNLSPSTSNSHITLFRNWEILWGSKPRQQNIRKVLITSSQLRVACCTMRKPPYTTKTRRVTRSAIRCTLVYGGLKHIAIVKFIKRGKQLAVSGIEISSHCVRIHAYVGVLLSHIYNILIAWTIFSCDWFNTN